MTYEDYRIIPLTQGQTAFVSAADFEWINQWKWSAHRNKDGVFYARRNSSRKDGKRVTIFMHRVILGLESGDKRDGEHREPSQTLDNRRSNLRIATRSQNLHNTRTKKSSSTGLKGARALRNGTYQSRISINGKQKFIGVFAKAMEAHLAYCYMAAHHLGEFARFA